MFARQLVPVRAGWMLTSMTPGSGVTANFFKRGSSGGEIALQHHGRAGFAGRLLNREDQRDEVLDARHRRQKHVHAARPRLHTQCSVDHLPCRLADRNLRRGRRGGVRLGVGFHDLIERRPRLERIGCMRLIMVLGRHPRQRAQRQAQPQRRVPRHQVEVLAAQRPVAAQPAPAARHGLGRGLDRQHEADRVAELLVEQCARRERSAASFKLCSSGSTFAGIARSALSTSTHPHRRG